MIMIIWFIKDFILLPGKISLHMKEMEHLLKKLNYKGQDRICIINSNKEFIEEIRRLKPELRIDEEIDPKYLYNFFLIFVRNTDELKETAPRSIHNLSADGILWFAYPKKNSRKYNSDLSRDTGWGVVIYHGFEPVRQVSVNEDWSALRFRDQRFIRRKKK